MLRDAALRITKPRLAVISAVDRLAHPDTESVIAAVREAIPDVSHQTVYDSLRTLSDLGILRRIQPAGSVARYETRTGDNHHHLVCRSCGAVVDVDCAIGETICLTPSEDHGFQIDEAEVVYWGVCPQCASTSAPAESADGAGAAASPEAVNTDAVDTDAVNTDAVNTEATKLKVASP
ncbi:transcriptional repressor [Xylanimonas allomyrinae]|uniref:Transcriptional repressor n=2 Tax=Xylanimonas allomyrinae TaxID=2509459 RepID=A0A4V0YEP1_9MICO|nr:transcriptional repressor [Xylanimonas allomyrinae]